MDSSELDYSEPLHSFEEERGFSGLPPMANGSSPHFRGNDSLGFHQFLKLHSAIERFQNFTRAAEIKATCRLDNDSSSDIYSYASRYKEFHGYIALAVCIFGVIANCCIMVVLRRKEMRTPINMMLMALALADLLIMAEYIPFSVHMYLMDQTREERYSFPSAAFVFFHVHFTQIIHTISIQLTLSMAIWRYVAIKVSNRANTFCTARKCYQVILAAYLCPFLFCTLNYIYFQIVPRTQYITKGPPPFNMFPTGDEDKLDTFLAVCKIVQVHDCTVKKVDQYFVESSDLVKAHPILHTIHFWTFSVLIKLIPCVLLTFFMCWLLNTLYKARRHHKMLEAKSALPMGSLNRKPDSPRGNGEASQPLSPSKTGNKLIHPQLPLPAVSPTRSIRFAPSTDKKMNGEEDHENGTTESQKAALLLAEEKSANGVVSSLAIVNSSLPDTVSGKVESRRPSGETSSGGGSARGSIRRFTKGFIRLPSLRRKSGDGGKGGKGCKKTDRTGKMLIAVLVLFLLTEFPQGIMHFLTGWYGEEFLRCAYNPSAEVWDILALINSAINFLIYCFMSKQFRTQFQISFRLHLCFRRPTWMTLPHCNNNPTISTTV